LRSNTRKGDKAVRHNDAVSSYPSTARSTVKIEKVEYAGWPNCYRMTNGEVEVIVTTDVGPRVIRYSFTGEENVFVEFREQLGQSGEKEWMARGGHRLWAAPERIPETYALDNSPVEATVSGSSILLLQPVEPETGLRKEMTVSLDASGPGVTITHRIENTRATPRRLAVWALTQMAPGGLAIAAFPPRGSHDEILLPTNPLTMWAYTNFSDPRWKFTQKYLTLRNDPANKEPQKSGLFNPKTVGAYLNQGTLFVKRSDAPGDSGDYPDFGCSFETFTNHSFLELETLAPLGDVKQGESATHVERWSLRRDVTLASINDAELDVLFGG
jgi:hypothetical protein